MSEDTPKKKMLISGESVTGEDLNSYNPIGSQETIYDDS